MHIYIFFFFCTCSIIHVYSYLSYCYALGGEFVFQAALPLDKNKMTGPILLGPSGNPVVKIFIFAEQSAYDFITQVYIM